jgi:predicted Rossmann fold flavoprotein
MNDTPKTDAHLVPTFDLIIIGAGAAGIFAGIQAKMLAPKRSVLILEATQHPLAKVKISGGGRCNVTHNSADLAYLLAHYPRGHKELASVLTRWMPQDTMDWFTQHGVPLKTEADGRVFPVSDNSQSIVDCLMGQLHQRGVLLYTNQRVGAIAYQPDQGFTITTQHTTFRAKTLLLATGGSPKLWQVISQPAPNGLGQAIVAPVPSLFTFNCKHPLLTDLAGVSVNHVALTLDNPKQAQHGPLMITHWGLSGPAVLKSSAVYARLLADCQYQHPFSIDFCPDLSWPQVEALLTEAKQVHAQKLLKTICPFPIPKRYWERLLQTLGFDVGQAVWASLNKAGIANIAQALKRQAFTLTGKGVFKDEFVTAGGVARKGVNFKTMASKHNPALFFAGEVLDVDGLTGGFNFQHAWASATIAAQGVASTQW